MGSSSQTLTEQSRCRERGACVRILRCCSSTNDRRDSLKFVQEVARFVTSRFFGKKSLGGSEKLLSLEKKSLSWQLLWQNMCLFCARVPSGVQYEWKRHHPQFHRRGLSLVLESNVTLSCFNWNKLALTDPEI